MTTEQPPFVITVSRTGGFAGLRRDWAVEVTGDDEARRWVPLIEACPWDDPTDDGVPDGFVWDVRAAGRAATLAEARLAGPWRDLVDEVRRAAEPPS